jgi:type II secretory pathway pseudopilin PulG
LYVDGYSLSPTNSIRDIYIENQYFISNTAAGNVKNQICTHLVDRLRRAIMKKETFRVFVILPNHPDGNLAESSLQQVMKWQYRTINRHHTSVLKTLEKEFPNTNLQEYIGFFCLRSYGFLKNERLYDEMKDLDELDETTDQDLDEDFLYTGLKAVTEQVYVHSKLMIVDDRYTIIGSANLNDRSMLGDRDSEIAVVIEDQEFYRNKMNGTRYKAGKFAFSLRMRLWKEHLGLFEDLNEENLDEDLEDMESQELSVSEKIREEISKSKRKLQRKQIRRVIRDPVSSKTYNSIWMHTAQKNTDIYESVFPNLVPSKKFKTLQEYLEARKKYQPMSERSAESQNAENERFLLLKQQQEQQKLLESQQANGEGSTEQPDSPQTTNIDLDSDIAYNNADAIRSPLPTDQTTIIDLSSTNTTSSSSRAKEGREEEMKRRKELGKIRGTLCMFPLEFAANDHFPKTVTLNLVDDSIFS